MNRSKSTQVACKSTLAKLLAQENIKVQHLNNKTASFNLRDRVLTCPIWKDMTGDLYDLCVGHEISHALHTSEEGWHTAVVDGENQGKKGYRTYLNVVEDCRIERLIKHKFPGLRKSFANAYKDLVNRDFFGLRSQKINIRKLAMIDRINLYFKAGHILPVQFTDEEQIFITRIEQAQTWSQVKQIADELYDRAKQKKDKLPEQEENEFGQNEQNDGGDSEGDQSEGDQSKDSGESEDGGESEDDESEGDESEDGAPSRDQSDQSSSEDNKNIEPDPTDPIAQTDEAFRENENRLVDAQATEIRIGYLPEIKDYTRLVIKNELVVKTIENGITQAFCETDSSNHVPLEQRRSMDTFRTICVDEILNTNKNYIDLLVKEFELRKNASQYARQMTAKTGDLDTKKLARYRFTNDLFKKITIVPKGQSHGMIFFLDMSSSMAYIMGETVRQLLVLVTFCNRVGIPFDVYGFCDGEVIAFTPGRFNDNINQSDVLISGNKNFHLKHLISSDLTNANFRRAFGALAMYSFTGYVPLQYCKPIKYRNIPHRCPFNEREMGMSLNGTPSSHMLITSRYIIQQFQRTKRVDIVNVIHLTDGDGTDSFRLPIPYGKTYASGYRIQYTDRATQISIIPSTVYNNAQETYTELVKRITGCRHIAFYIGDMSNIKYYAKQIARSNNLDDQKKENIYKTQLDKHGFFAVSRAGYDSFYYMAISNAGEDNLIVQPGDSIQRAFIVHMSKKAKRRAIVKRFASEIAEQIQRN